MTFQKSSEQYFVVLNFSRCRFWPKCTHCADFDEMQRFAQTTFFWCYLSSQLTELIDMLPSEETKISMRTRNVPGMTLGSLWPPGVSALIARWTSGPSTVQNSLGRKWDTKLTEFGHIRAFRAGPGPLWRLARPSGPRRTSDRFHPARQSLLSTDHKNFTTSHFSNFS